MKPFNLDWGVVGALDIKTRFEGRWEQHLHELSYHRNEAGECLNDLNLTPREKSLAYHFFLYGVCDADSAIRYHLSEQNENS